MSSVSASLHEVDVLYASFDNHKMSDFKPYLFRSRDRGGSWESVTGNLPDNGSVYAIAEDHENPDLLFAGTEYGVFFTIDGGDHWTQLEGGVPTIAVRDIAIQRRENDLVLGTFGRGFYVLDDYSPLRQVNAASLESEATLFPDAISREALVLHCGEPAGGRRLHLPPERGARYVEEEAPKGRGAHRS